ncbi:hypothetical protein [Leucothrix mucor]|uniref:hypothetical protein n=1 Tax=Leucothrix mucor TaxID=45248 RepID=UPI0003B6D2E5|nr:hypothetical protein [Leucothrix mucor]
MSQLSTPEKKKVEAALLTTVSQANNWVAALPLTNMGEVTRLLYQSLVAINQHPITPVLRIDITEVLLPYVNIALENLDRHFSTRSFPLPERSQKVFDLKQALQLELAGSYQLAALDMLTRGSISQKRLIIAIGRAIRYMGRSLMNSNSVYIKVKRNIWHDVHHLYLLACENKIESKPIPKMQDGQGELLSIEAYYKLFNLVALGVPNSLRQGEVERLEKFFASVVNSVSILPDADHIQGEYAHIALLNSDESAALMPVSEVLNSATSRIFDVSKVEKILRDFIDLTTDSNFGLHQDQPMLNRGLAKRLLTKLTTSSNRKNKRFPRDEVAGVVMRLSDVFSVVRESTFDLEEDDAAVVEDNLYERMAQGDPVSSPWVELDVAASLEDSSVEVQPWHIDNSSAKGYGLRQKVIEPSAARVGEVVAIRDPSDETDNWQIGVIRWMDFYRDKGLCFGAELLSPKAMGLVVTAIKNREAPQRLPINGLFLPKIEGVHEKPRLILPGHMFILEDILNIVLGGREEQIQIIAIDECTGSFAYCDYVGMEKEEPVETENDFSEVWDLI